MGLGQQGPNNSHHVMVRKSYIVTCHSVKYAMLHKHVRSVVPMSTKVHVIRYGVVGNWSNNLYFIILFGTLACPSMARG
jgi:hypothetical protein